MQPLDYRQACSAQLRFVTGNITFRNGDYHLMTVLKKFWEGWKRVGTFIGDFIGRLVLTLFYFTLVLPFGLVMRLVRDPLTLKKSDPPSWQVREKDEASLDAARRLS
jgi:hypothetical protein